MRSNGPVDDTQRLAHDFWLAGKQEPDVSTSILNTRLSRYAQVMPSEKDKKVIVIRQNRGLSPVF
ncbi:MAG: hypothetical protein ACC707_09615 [Thiohalomonadales bacterium]